MHDRNGSPLKKGDEVLIPAIITELSPGEEYCNVTLKTVSGRRPDKQQETISAINTGVLVKYASAAVALLLFCVGIAQADSWKITRRGNSSVWVVTESSKPASPAPALPTGSESKESLDEVNKARAERGLAPFQHDPQLSQAAYSAAKERAAKQIPGHVDDYAHLPTGAKADSAGCGALEPSWGWGTCCTYDNYSHAGAAWVMGSDGRRYMHLFVRNGTPAMATKTEPVTYYQSTGTCANGSCSLPGGIITRGRRGR